MSQQFYTHSIYFPSQYHVTILSEIGSKNIFLEHRYEFLENLEKNCEILQECIENIRGTCELRPNYLRKSPKKFLKMFTELNVNSYNASK